MRAHEVDFMTLVQGTKQFQVPLYQRSYSWGSIQLDQLWDDIRREAGAVNPPAGSGHFLGSIVLAPCNGMHAGGLQRWLVVDGQQRLATLTLALAALRDHVLDRDQLWADRIDDEYLINKWQGGEGRLRFLPTQDDRQAFSDIVLRTAPPPEDGTVGTAYSRFRDWLVEVDDGAGEPGLRQIEHTVRQRLRFVEITADQTDNVHRIFQTLNGTGLRLRQSDLVRNHLFMLLPTTVDDVYRDHWLPMQKLVGSAGLEELLWLDLLLRGQDSAPQSDVYRLQASRWEKVGPDEAALAQEVKGLGRLARRYHLMINPGGEPDPVLGSQMRRLEAWGGVSHRPVMLFMLSLREEGVISAEVAADALRLVEGFLVRRMLAGVPTNSLGRILNAVPRELGSSTDAITDLRSYLSATRRFWPTDEQLTDAIQTQPFYTNSRTVHRVFVLRRIEEDLRLKEIVDWERSTLTIEHVMPRTLTPEWRRVLKKEADRYGITIDELHRLVVHTLGNLTLTGSNSELSNHPVQRKKDILARSALAMNQRIAASGDWNSEAISRRGMEIAQQAVRIWPGPSPDSDSGKGSDWARLHVVLGRIPAGRWTTFSDLAELVGTHPVSVGNHLAARRVMVNTWRVLMANGRPSPQFRWDRPQTQREVLESEGVQFDRTGRARKDQRLHPDALAALERR